MIFLSPLKKLSKTQSKKQIKNPLFLSILVSTMLIFSSCENIFSGRENSPAGNSGDKTYLTISLGKLKNTRTRASASGRTVYPLGISVSQLKNFKLTGAFENGEEQELFTAEDSSGFANKSLEILPGNWAFTLTASFFDSATSNDIVYSDSINYEIRRGVKNLISFELKPQLSGNGGFKITVNLPGDNKLDKVRATLTSLSGSVIETKDLEITSPTNPDDPITATYSKANITDENGGLEPGSYHLLLEFLAAKVANPSASADDWILVNQWESYVCIIAQKISTADLNLDFNTLYTISYKNADGGPITDFYEGLAITKYSPGSAFTLPRPKINGKVFLGWKRQDTGEDISEIKATDRTDFTLVAQTAEPVLYVSGTGYDNIEPDEHGNFGDGSEEHPFESIDKSCEKIIELGNPDVNWTIYIDGDVTGPHEGTRKAGSRNYSSDYGRSIIPVEITQEHAKSILLKGKNDPGETAGVPNAPTDMINRGLSSSSNSDTGSALVIATAVPVKVENLLIKNGCNKPANSSSDPYSEKGGGLFIASEATVTLGYGVIISNNNAKTAGGGIYNEGTLFINGSAEISSNNCVDGGGICNTGHLYLGYEDSATEKEWTGSIKNNTSWQGAGIKNLANAELVMSSGSVNHNSCANNSSTSGGGIWNMGSFTMTNGVIEFNDCCQGGGVYNGYSNASEFGTFTFSGGKIKNNFANYVYGTNVSNGGGIYNTGVTYIYGEAIIGDETASALPTDNTGAQERDIANTSIDETCSNLALGLGGGIYVGAQGKLFLGYSRYVDATDNTPAVWNKGIYYNYAKKGGGGIAYGPSAKTVIFNSGTVSFNGATSNGAAAYIGAEGFVLGGTATIPSGNGDGSPKQTVYVLTNNYSLSIDNALSHLDTGAIALLPQDNSNSSTPVPTSYNTYKPLIKLTDTAVADGVTIDSIKGKFTVENFTDPTSGRVTKWSINSEGKAQIETSAGFSASLDIGTADIVVFRNGYSFTPPIVESASSTSTITLDVKKIAGKDFDKSTMTLVWTFDGEELNRASMPEAVSFRYSDSDRQIDINSGMLAKGTYDVCVEATYTDEHYSFVTQIIKN